MAPPTPPGTLVAGKYRIERVLGQGGMGVVVAARHIDLGELVAIKFPTVSEREPRRSAARLIREGRAAMKIRSEHVARVYDVGTLDTGEPYLVMEYLVGRDLAALLAKDGPLPVGAAVEYVLQAIEALAEAHARGIVHRDIKPSNLFLSRRADGSPMVKVIDFGISKSQLSGPEAGLTCSEGALGTPLFMAPEQMAAAHAVDARSDIWSLGATCHALVTGEPPFPAGSIVDIHKRILQGTPTLRACLPDAPLALETALLQCMQCDPGARFATVAELAEALFDVAPVRARVSIERAARILTSASLDGDSNPNTPSSSEGVSQTSGQACAPTERATETGMSAGVSWLEARPQAHSAGRSLPVTLADVKRAALPTRSRGLGFAVAGILAAALVLAGYRVGSAPTNVVVASAWVSPTTSTLPVSMPVPERSAALPAPRARDIDEPRPPAALANPSRDVEPATSPPTVGLGARLPQPADRRRAVRDNAQPADRPATVRGDSPQAAAPPLASGSPAQPEDPLADPD